MTQKAAKPLEIFRVGEHTSSDGVKMNFTAEMLRGIATGYDPKKLQAPLVVGHPRTDDPAYGWVQGLAFREEDGTLLAIPEQVDAEFGDMVNAGRFKNISSSLMSPSHPSNPNPGSYSLKHVGFLGAQAPAVKGLKPAEFSDEHPDLVHEFEMPNYSGRVIARMFQSLRDWMIDTAGLDSADKTLSAYDIEYLEDLAREPSQDTMPESAFSEPLEPDMPTTKTTTTTSTPTPAGDNGTITDFAQREADFQAREAKLQADVDALNKREKDLKAAAQATHRNHVTSFVDGLVSDGKLLPRCRPGMVEALAAIAPDTSLEFSEGEGDDANTVKTDAYSVITGALRGLGKQVDFNSKSGTDESSYVPTDGGLVEVNGKVMDSKKVELDQRINQYMDEHEGVSYVAAYHAVTRQQ